MVAPRFKRTKNILSDGPPMSSKIGSFEVKSLSKLIREAADHAFWLTEVERIAALIGCDNREDVEVAWQAVSEIVDSIAIIAFEHRHNSDELIPILKEWYADQQIRLRVRTDLKHSNLDSKVAELPTDRIVLTVLWRILCKVETAYEQYELGIQSKLMLGHLDPPKLKPNEAQLASEVASHLHKAVNKVKNLQAQINPPSFEFDVYQSILEAAYRHFEEMGNSGKEAQEEAA